MSQPEQKIVLVTGAAGAIGGAVAIAFAANRFRLLLSDVTTPSCMADLQAQGNQVTFLKCDLAKLEDVARLFEQIQLQTDRLDVLVNAAGVVSKGPSIDVTESEWDRVFDINLKATFFACRHAIEMMKRHNYGRVINIGSVVGRNGGNARPWLYPHEPFASSNVAYCAAKAGVHAITGFLGRESAQFGITVNAVAPGPIRTPMIESYPDALIQQIPSLRLGEPEEVAEAVLYLASDRAGFVNGATIDMNGALFVG